MKSPASVKRAEQEKPIVLVTVSRPRWRISLRRAGNELIDLTSELAEAHEGGQHELQVYEDAIAVRKTACVRLGENKRGERSQWPTPRRSLLVRDLGVQAAVFDSKLATF